MGFAHAFCAYGFPIFCVFIIALKCGKSVCAALCFPV